jgi:hypothetical protein
MQTELKSIGEPEGRHIGEKYWGRIRITVAMRIENTVPASCNDTERHDIFPEILIVVDLFLEMKENTCLS